MTKQVIKTSLFKDW